ASPVLLQPARRRLRHDHHRVVERLPELEPAADVVGTGLGGGGAGRLRVAARRHDEDGAGDGDRHQRGSGGDQPPGAARALIDGIGLRVIKRRDRRGRLIVDGGPGLIGGIGSDLTGRRPTSQLLPRGQFSVRGQLLLRPRLGQLVVVRGFVFLPVLRYVAGGGGGGGKPREGRARLGEVVRGGTLPAARRGRPRAPLPRRVPVHHGVTGRRRGEGRRDVRFVGHVPGRLPLRHQVGRHQRGRVRGR